MKSIRSFIGRRQFLFAAGAASTCALACKKLAGLVDSDFKTGVAMAGEKAGASDEKTTIQKYPHLLSPLKIRNKILKNRMIHTMGFPQHLNGPEAWPPDIYREYYARFARNGAAIVIVPPVVVAEDVGKPGYGYMEGPWTPEGKYGDSLRRAREERFDTRNPAVENYLDQMVAAAHAYGSLVSEIGMTSNLKGDTIEEAVESAKALEAKGVDVILMPVEFEDTGIQHKIAKDYKDSEGVKWNIERMEAIKKATGQIISMKINVSSVEDAVNIAKIYDGVLDILQFRQMGGPTLHIAKAIRESGSKVYLAPNGGFQDLDENEELIASGQVDLITMCRAWLADFEYGQKAYEGRGDDVVPCIQCNKCHGPAMGGAPGKLESGPWVSICSVNPKLGLDVAEHIIIPPDVTKRVAVIGGGPAGMYAALTAAERGHEVTLYEKEASLGGLLRHSDFTSSQGVLKRYKDYLIRQVKKAGFEVVLNKMVTPEMIKAKGYDVVVAAVGAEPSMPRIPGTDSKNVYNLMDAYSKEKEMGKNVVVAGTGTYCMSVGMFLAGSGHNVTYLSGDKGQSGSAPGSGQRDNSNIIREAVLTGISEGKLTYRDAEGNEKSIQTDSVVLYEGLKPRQDEALKFFNAAGKAFFTVGDCTGMCGNIQKAIRNAYFSASQF